jgi:formate-dependent nitrite reductase membrane component NrfD
MNGPGHGGERDRWQGRLEHGDQPAGLAASEEPPESTRAREAAWTADHDTQTRDMTPAVGKPGGPASWRPAVDGAPVSLARPGFGDARWSFLYRARDTGYASVEPGPGQIEAANRRMRESAAGQLYGPFIKPPVWTWEVPLYFWVGGLASGSAFVASACDAAGDHDSARVARKLALGAVSVAPPLLIADLGRPARFLNMLRIVKPRSPMNLGAWCLVAFSATAAGGVAADFLRRPRAARALGLTTTVLGSYLGSYTGVLLAATAVPLWARSRAVLAPTFICTATASGAAATRLALVARGMADSHPTQRALGHVETASILAEVALSQAHNRKLGSIGDVMHRGRAGLLFRAAETSVIAGVSVRLAGRWATPVVRDVASGLILAGALAFRYAWVQAGKASAVDHASVVAMARGRQGLEDPTEVPGEAREQTRRRSPLGRGRLRPAWSETVRRASLAVEGLVSGR